MSRWPPTARMQDRILEAADRLFYFRGIRAIGVDAVAEAVGISKRTLYNHFPSKEALVLAYLARRLATTGASDAPPAGQILARFDRLERNVAGGGFRGCPFVNAVTELGEPDHPVNALAVEFKEQQRQWLRELAARAGAADPELLATQLALLVDGAIAAALVRGDAGFVRAARAAAATLLAAAGVAVPPEDGAPAP